MALTVCRRAAAVTQARAADRATGVTEGPRCPTPPELQRFGGNPEPSLDSPVRALL